MYKQYCTFKKKTKTTVDLNCFIFQRQNSI